MASRTRALLLLFTATTWLAAADVATAGPVFNVTDFGAVADGKTDNSRAFLRAWTKACATPGRATVFVPGAGAGGSYLLHPLVFRGPCRGFMELRVAGVLLAPPGLAAFSGCREWVHFSSLDGLLLTGGGTFDGHGSTAWPLNDCPKKRDCKLLPTVSTKAPSDPSRSIGKSTALNDFA